LRITTKGENNFYERENQGKIKKARSVAKELLLIEIYNNRQTIICQLLYISSILDYFATDQPFELYSILAPF
jgi:hypothetical protein